MRQIAIRASSIFFTVSMFPGIGLTQQLAAYSAGLAGSPAVAPDPVTQGWTLSDPSLGVVSLTDVSPDGASGLNAWQIDDQATFVGGRAHYAGLFSPSELDSAALDGWAFEVTMRLVAASGVNAFYEFASGTAATDDRYLVFFTVSGNDVIANLFLSGLTYVCTGGNDGSYHTYRIQKPAGAVDAEFYFDGALLGVLPRENSNANAPAGGVHWGSGSSLETCTVNFNAVSFRIEGNIGTNYCLSLPSSSGNAAMISAVGSTSVSDQNLGLMAAGLPNNVNGIFYFGANQISTPFGDGFRCVGGATFRLPIGSADGMGVLTEADVYSTPNGGQIVAGATFNFQAWFRDSAAMMSGFNLSDGISVTFGP